jgi:hypothetical protein
MFDPMINLCTAIPHQLKNVIVEKTKTRRETVSREILYADISLYLLFFDSTFYLFNG